MGENLVNLLNRAYRFSRAQRSIQEAKVAAIDRRARPVACVCHVFLRKCFGLAARVVVKAVKRRGEVPFCIEYLGSEFWFPTRSQIGWHIAGGGEWDGLMRDVLPPVLGAPRVCIEIGSNIGASTVLIKSLFPEVALVCAEPVERYRAYLLENLRPYSHVLHVEDRIIASRSGQTATIQANSTTASASNADYGTDFRGRETLFTISLDDLVEHLGLKGQIDFIKVDTDGYEHEVVSGGRRCLEDDKPLLFVEFCPPALRRVLRSEKELVEVLLEVGCQVFMVYHPNGSFLGVARDYDRIMTLKQNLYYVDLFTLPSRSKHEGAFLDFVTSVESVRARPE